MSNTKYILGSFADPDEMMHGIDKLQANNISIYDCFTPMPIHGIEAKLGVKPSQLIAAGRGEYIPLVENTSADNRSKNRRTRIVVLPKIDEFYDMIEKEMKNQKK